MLMFEFLSTTFFSKLNSVHERALMSEDVDYS